MSNTQRPLNEHGAHLAPGLASAINFERGVIPDPAFPIVSPGTSAGGGTTKALGEPDPASLFFGPRTLGDPAPGAPAPPANNASSRARSDVTVGLTVDVALGATTTAADDVDDVDDVMDAASPVASEDDRRLHASGADVDGSAYEEEKTVYPHG